MAEVQIDINDVASVGVVRDSPPHNIPPEAWTLAENVRFEDDSVVQLLGYTQIFGTPTVAPYYAQFVSAPGQPWWLYAGLSKIIAYNGTTHFDVTRTTDGAVYNATGAAQWNGTNIGGIPVLNNGVDVPQYWPSFSGATKMANLLNWPGTLRFSARRGDIVLRISAKAAFSVHLHTDNGILFTDFGLRGTSSGGAETIDGSVNGGTTQRIDVETSSGAIRLLRLQPQA